ncbi:hypothetical protein [Streptomyces sp. NPDC101393]|uniref:hypothetical protein n=1 Tax=Streptomyces sp. NPDC101393 TaxID=3366141 RepID=UPI00381BE0EB
MITAVVEDLATLVITDDLGDDVRQAATVWVWAGGVPAVANQDVLNAIPADGNDADPVVHDVILIC